MAGQLSIQRMTARDQDYVATNLRAVDLREMHRLVGPVDPAGIIDFTTSRAVAAWAAFYDGVPICIFGVNRRSLMSDVGVPWMLGTDEVERQGWPFVRLSREYVQRIAQVFPQQENWVDAENALAVGWLRWLGFDMDDPKPAGVAGAPFIRFSRGFASVS